MQHTFTTQTPLIICLFGKLTLLDRLYQPLSPITMSSSKILLPLAIFMALCMRKTEPYCPLKDPNLTRTKPFIHSLTTVTLSCNCRLLFHLISAAAAQAGRILKSSEEFYHHHQKLLNHTADIYSSFKNYTTSLHNYTVEVPEVFVSIYNHTRNKTNAYLEELSGHVSSLFNHSDEGEVTNYTHSDIRQALFNYTKQVHHAAESAKKYELPTFTVPTFNHTKVNHTFTLPTFNHTKVNHTFTLPTYNHTKVNHTFTLPTYNHTKVNHTFTLPTFNHSDLRHASTTGVLSKATEEYTAFVEKHG